MKWYKPEENELLFSGTEAMEGKRVGVLAASYSSHYLKLTTMESAPADYDKMLLKYLDETDILDLGWDKTSDSGHEYWSKSGDWFLTLTFDKVFIRKSFNDDMEVNVKNKQQLKLLMQFLGIAN